MAPSTRRLYNFRADPELDAGLEAVKIRDGIPKSEQIRRAVREWLERKGVLEAERKRASTRRRS